MKRLITITAAALTLGLAASPAASAAVASGKSGTEVIQGSTTKLSAITSNAPVVPLKAHGVVDTYGTINLGGPTNGRSTLHVPRRQPQGQAHADQHQVELQPEYMRG